MTTRALAAALFALLTACATRSERAPLSPRKLEAAEARGRSGNCARFEEWLGGACVKVTVLGVAESPLSFARDGHAFDGTLLKPVTRGVYRAPGVVLLHDAGPQDRDGSTTGHLGFTYPKRIPTYRLLAEALAQEGFAVYRFDKRTCFRENSEGRCAQLASKYPGALDALRHQDLLEDARGAVRALQAAPGVRGRELLVIGHGEGGGLVPWLLGQEPEVVAGVMLAAAAEPLDQGTVARLRAYAAALEARKVQPLAEEVRAEAVLCEKGFRALRAGRWGEPTFRCAGMSMTTAQWEDWLQSTDQVRQRFLAVDKPMLLLQGEHDFDTSTDQLGRFEAWAQEAGKMSAMFQLLPNTTHGLVRIDEEAELVEPLSARAVALMLQWYRSLQTDSLR